MSMHKFAFNDRDEFQRKPIAEKIITLLTSNIDISPLVIDGDWGTGKTEFCYKLINLFEQKESHQLIYIDAFKADHINEPLLTIIAELIKLQPEKKRIELRNKFSAIMRSGLKISGKALTSHILKQDTESITDEYEKAIQEGTEKALNATVDILLKDHIEAEKNLETLQEIISSLTQKKPLVIFIDELDRCRPNFAIKLLEVIKHTFNINNVQFVLVTNMKQLKASVNHCYGSAINAQNYLDKFLMYQIELPIKTQNSLVSVEHFKNLVRKSDKLKNTVLNERNNYRKELVYQCIENSNISLREVETLIRHFIVYEVLNSGNLDIEELIAICLYVIRPDNASKILKGNSDANDIASFLGLNEFSSSGRHHSPNFAQLFGVLLASECKFNSQKFSQILREEPWKDMLLQLSDGFPFDEHDRKEVMRKFIQTLSNLSLNTTMVVYDE